MEAALDFSFIYDLVKDVYSEVGRPSIDPVILVKLPFIQYTFGIRSMRHIWQEYVEEADHLRHKPEVKQIYAKRKETIERVFADAKEKHGMRWTTLRGLKKLSMQAMLTFAALNLKKMANWTWRSPVMA
nr:transposase [Mesobacillus subterraneus]